MKKTNKLISILLVVVMLLSMAPMSLMASAALTPTAIGGCDGNHSGYTEINSKKTITKAGNYYLTGNVSVTDYSYPLKIQCSGTVTLCLNGYDLYHDGNGNCVVEIIATGGDLTVNLCDCKGTGEIYHNKRKAGIYLFGDDSNGYYTTLNMYGGTIRDCSSGVDESYNTRFNMYGGTIKNCSKYGVFQSRYDGKVNIYGGTITGNTEGICVCTADAVTLTGSPIISGNTNGDLYFRNNNSPIIAKNLSVNEKITIAQYTAADCVVVKVDSEEAYDCFEALDPNARVISHNDNTIWFHGDHPWKDASCTEPKTCQSCGMTEGDPLGHDWSNLDGICANGCGYECLHENLTGEICEICGKSLHTHSFTYTASGDTITAVCTTEGCDLENGDGGYITISAPADLYADGTTAKEAVVDNQLADTSVTYEIVYTDANDATSTEAPKAAGTYTASVTIGGATATVQFEIIKRSSTAENFIYTAPENLVYDGTPKYATVEASPEITGMGEITVSYYQNGEAVEPINAGTYTVKVSIAESDKYYAINGVDLGTFTIEKKAVTVSATVVDKVYDGTPTVDPSSINITIDGIIDGDDVVVDKCNGIFTNANAKNNKTVMVSYSLSGDDVSNYAVYEDGVSFPEKEYYFVETKANILPKDISNAEITLGDALTYTGEEQTQTVTAVTVDGLDVTYTVSGNIAKNVGVYQLTITGTGNFTGEATALYEIAVDVSGLDYSEIDGYFWSDVKSTDKDRLEYVYNQLRNASTEYADEDKKTEWFILLNNCNEMLLMIKSVTTHLESFKNTVAQYDVDTVTSADYDYLEELYESEAWWLDFYFDNYTDEEIKEFSDTLRILSKLTSRIFKVTNEYNRVIAAANGYDETTVTSADKDALVQLDTDIFALALTNNVTSEEKTSLMFAHSNVFVCIQKITYISEEIKRVVAELEKYVFESVKSDDKADIEQLIEDIKALLDTQNITADERTILETADETCDKLIAKIYETVTEINRINDATNAYDEATVTSADKEAVEKLIADIKALTDGDNITESERAQLVANDETLDALLAKINATAEEFERINSEVDSYDVDSVKSPDREAVEQLKEDIEALKATDNVSEEEKAVLEEKLEKVNGLISRITQIEELLEEMTEIENEYNPEKVTSDNKAAIEDKIAEIEAVNPDNLTDEQKAEYEEIKAGFDALLEEIAAAGNAVADIGVELEMFDEKRATIFWEDDIEALKSKIDELLADENMGEAEKAKLNEYKAQADNLIEIINNPCKYFSMRLFYFVWDALNWLSSHVVFIFNWIVAMF